MSEWLCGFCVCFWDEDTCFDVYLVSVLFWDENTCLAVYLVSAPFWGCRRLILCICWG